MTSDLRPKVENSNFITQKKLNYYRKARFGVRTDLKKNIEDKFKFTIH